MKRIYTCEGCGDRVNDGDENFVIETHPHLFSLDGKMREVIIKLELGSGKSRPEEKLYHTKWVPSKFVPGGCACCGGHVKVICGALHEETIEEYYVHQACSE